MLHPSYTDLMEVVNSDAEQREQPVVQSRYSIVLATAKRARQIIGGQEPLVRSKGKGIKPLSVAVEELHESKIKVLTEEEAEEMARLRRIQLAEARKAAKLAAEKAAKEKNSEDTETEEGVEEGAVERVQEIDTHIEETAEETQTDGESENQEETVEE